jgi:hypothetical protein
LAHGFSVLFGWFWFAIVGILRTHQLTRKASEMLLYVATDRDIKKALLMAEALDY